MARVLIALRAPTLDRSFDMFLPDDVTIGELIPIICDGLAQITNGYYQKSGAELLCMKDPDKLLNPDKTLSDYNVRSGDQLVFF